MADNTGNQILVGTPSAGTPVGGDLAGSTAAATVTGLEGKPVTAPLATDDTKFLQYNNSSGLYQWSPAAGGASVTMGGDVSGLSSGASVDKAKGTPLPTPGAPDDQKLLTYLSGSTAYALRTPAVKVTTKTTAYTLTADDYAVLADASGAPFAVTLPTAVGITHRAYIVKKKDSSANAVTLQAAGIETIDGANAAVVSIPYTALMVVSDGVAWYIL